MLKLKKILKEGVYGKFWWMNPQGKLHRVMKIDADTGHRESAIDILTVMGVKPLPDVFQQMYQYGWLRVGFIGEGNYFTLSFNAGYGKEPNIRQMSSLKDLAIELKADEIRNNSTNQRYYI